MTLLTPLPTGLAIRQDSCDLVRLYWRQERLLADFSISLASVAKSLAVRVKFDSVKQFRVVDEMIYSIEKCLPLQGNDPAGFAYVVEDGKFWQMLDETVKHIFPSLVQYTFISLNSCIDVIATDRPSFEMIELNLDDPA